MGISKDIHNRQANVVSVLAPVAVAASNNGESLTRLDTSKYVNLALVVHAGVCTDGEYTISVGTSAVAAGGAFAAQTVNLSEWVSGVAPTVITSSEDEKIWAYDVNIDRLDNRYIAPVITESSGGTTGVILGLSWVGELKRGV